MSCKHHHQHSTLAHLHGKMSSSEEAREVGEEQPSVEAELEDAKRFFALKEWSQAADGYGEVLELL